MSTQVDQMDLQADKDCSSDGVHVQQQAGDSNCFISPEHSNEGRDEMIETQDEDSMDGVKPTETVQQGLLAMKARKDGIEVKIDDMISVTVEFLDTLKEQFVARMSRMKSELDTHCQQQTILWLNVSAETNNLYHRLQSAQDLVQSFNCQAVLPIQ